MQTRFELNFDSANLVHTLLFLLLFLFSLFHSTTSKSSCLSDYPYLRNANGEFLSTEEECTEVYRAYWGQDLPTTRSKAASASKDVHRSTKSKDLKLTTSPLLNSSYLLRKEPTHDGERGTIMKVTGNLTTPSLFFWNKERHLSFEYADLVRANGVMCKDDPKKLDFYLDEGRKIEPNKHYDLYNLPKKDPARMKIATLSCYENEMCPVGSAQPKQAECHQQCSINVTNPCTGEISSIDLETHRIKSIGAKRYTSATLNQKNADNSVETLCLEKKPYRDYPGLRALFEWVKYLHSSLMVASETYPVVKRWTTAKAYKNIQTCNHAIEDSPHVRKPASVVEPTQTSSAI